MRNLFSILLLLVSCSAYAAQDSGEERINAAYKLFEAMGMEEQLKETIERMVAVEVQNNPGLVPYRHVLIRFYNRHIGFETSKFETAELYAEAFTLKEIEELTSFYNTSLGQKVVKRTPELVQRSSQMGMHAVQSNIHELQDMIKDESLRIQKLQQSAANQ